MKILPILLLATLTAAIALPATLADTQTPAASAAGGPPGSKPGLKAGRRFRQIVRAGVIRRLGLTDQQKTQAKAIRKSTATAVKAIRGDASLTPEQKKQKIAGARLAGLQQFRGMLTDAQKQKLAHIQKKLLRLRRSNLR
jgi:hypothetical protein